MPRSQKSCFAASLAAFTACLLLLLAPQIGAIETAVSVDRIVAEIDLTLDSTAEEIHRFEQLVVELNASRDPALQALASAAQDVLSAAKAGDEEAFVAALAVYQLRSQKLVPEAQEAVVDARSRAWNLVPPTEPLIETISVTYGCGAELPCDDGSRQSCSCSRGTCEADPIYNASGGRVICDCDGTSSTNTRTCPAVNSQGCTNNLQCYTASQCGSGGGTCVNRNCICY